MTAIEAVVMGLWLLGTILGAKSLIPFARREGAQVREQRWRARRDLVVLQTVPLVVLERPPILHDWLFYPALLALCGVSLRLELLARHRSE